MQSLWIQVAVFRHGHVRPLDSSRFTLLNSVMAIIPLFYDLPKRVTPTGNCLRRLGRFIWISIVRRTRRRVICHIAVGTCVWYYGVARSLAARDGESLSICENEGCVVGWLWQIWRWKIRYQWASSKVFKRLISSFFFSIIATVKYVFITI